MPDTHSDPIHPDEPPREPLWPGGDAGAGPSLTFRAVDGTPRGAVMVIPGGGYSFVSMANEGRPIAAALHAAGFDVAVLRYRVAPLAKHPDMIRDAAEGIRLLRRKLRAAGRPTRVGVLGFSAGGHLAASLALHGDRFDEEPPAQRDPDTAVDALVLGYPVIDLLPPRAHAGSRLALLGEDPDPALLDAMCLHRHVTAAAPPAFLFHTANDGPVPVGNTLAYAAACEAAGVPFSCHVYEDGPHGVGLASDHPEAHLWFPAAAAFLARHLSGG